MEWQVSLTLHSDRRSSHILRVVDIDPLCVKSQKIAHLIYTAIEASNRASLHADDTQGRLRNLWARYQFKFVGPIRVYANSESDHRDRKIRGITYKTCFTQNSNFAHLSTTPDDRAPFSCMECDSLKPAMLIIAVTTIRVLLFSTQSY
jgi:hypothetical protein